MQAEYVDDLLPLDLRQSLIPIAEWIANSKSRNCRFATPTKPAVLAWWESGMPRNLVPVVIEKNDELTDYYCFNLDCGSPVVVFCDHAIVNCWDSVDAFIAWLTVQA
ncbi:MAG: hypothetical protein NTY15_07620 [Planctomycetota bacterium]|nr:hypothetical protein [Planctomycetota bacterium]